MRALRIVLRLTNAALWAWSVWHFLSYLAAVDRQERLRLALLGSPESQASMQELDDFYGWQAHWLANQDR